MLKMSKFRGIFDLKENDTIVNIPLVAHLNFWSES